MQHVLFKGKPILMSNEKDLARSGRKLAQRNKSMPSLHNSHDSMDGFDAYKGYKMIEASQDVWKQVPPS